MNLKRLIVVIVVALGVTPSLHAELVDQISGPFVPTFYTGPMGAGYRALAVYDTDPLLNPDPLPAPQLPRNIFTPYENFKFVSSGVIDSLSWVGSYQPAIPVPGPFDYEVNFYSTLPATGTTTPALQSFTLTPADFTRTLLLSDPLAGGDYYQYSTTATPFSVIGGTDYFVSIVAKTVFFDNAWGLAFSEIGDNASVQDSYNDLTSLFTRNSDAVDYAIRLSAVPEPGSLSAIVVVLGLVSLGRRRIAKKVSFGGGK